jgi:hypothetical protein
MLLDEDLNPVPPFRDAHGRPQPPYVTAEGELIE